MSVYFIRPVGMDGPVKIGFGHAPKERCGVLETWSPFPLEVAAQIKGGGQLERRFHALFKDQHSHREWFEWSAELEAVIQAVRAGTFDVEALPPPSKIAARGNTRPRTEGERYANSVLHRVRRLYARGMPFGERGCPHFSTFRHLDGPALDTARAGAERFFEQASLKFPVGTATEMEAA